VAQWTCPVCRRRFGHPRQSHVCEPGLTLEQYLERQPPAQRPVYRAVLRALTKLGELDIDPVEVGIMIKRHSTFCELRPKRGAVELAFKLSRPLASPRIRRTLRVSTHRTAYVLLLTSAREVDAELRSWLVESYLDSPE
jgi:hypothetical protein